MRSIWDPNEKLRVLQQLDPVLARASSGVVNTFVPILPLKFSLAATMASLLLPPVLASILRMLRVEVSYASPPPPLPIYFSTRFTTGLESATVVVPVNNVEIRPDSYSKSVKSTRVFIYSFLKYCKKESPSDFT